MSSNADRRRQGVCLGATTDQAQVKEILFWDCGVAADVVVSSLNAMRMMVLIRPGPALEKYWQGWNGGGRLVQWESTPGWRSPGQCGA